MARIRSVKPELRTSLTVASWPIGARYFWVLLWGYADDHGRGVDDVRLIRADAFPLDGPEYLDFIEEWLQMFAAAGVIQRYEVDGRRFFAIVNWTEHQRVSHPTASKIPDPPHSGEHPEPLASDSGEAPSRGEGSREGSREGEAPPPRFCGKHPEGTDGPCGPCRDRRIAREEWDKQHAVSSIAGLRDFGADSPFAGQEWMVDRS